MSNEDFLPHTSIITEELWQEKEYWLGNLSGKLEKSYFPYDFTIKNREQWKQDKVTFIFTGDVFSRLMQLRNDSDPRLHMILAAVVTLLVNKYTGNRDIIVGTTIDKQDAASQYINTILPLRNRIEDDMTFKQLLLQMRDTVVRAIENQNYPVEDLQDQLDISDDHKESLLFDTAVLLENIQDREYIEHVHCSLIFSFDRTAATMAGTILYNSCQYRETTIQQLASHFIYLLRRCIFNIDLPLREIDIISDREKEILLNHFNGNRAEFPTTRTIHHFVREHAEKNPHRIALAMAGKTPAENEFITYAQLNDRIHIRARLLTENGIEEDQLVGILMKRSLLLVELILATWKAGGAYIPIDPAYPERRVIDILTDAKARVLYTDSQYISADLEESFAGNILKSDLPVKDVNAGYTDGQHPENSASMKNINSLAYVIYTSGSTGKPKGAMIEHIGMMNHIQAKINDLQLTENSIVAQNASHTFDISVWQFFAALVPGGKTVIYSQPLVLEVEQLASCLIRDNITILEVVPSYLTVLLDALERMNMNPRQLQQLKYLLVTGETVKPHLLRRWFARYPGITVINAYGPTEASDDITHFVITQSPDEDMERVPIGKPVQNLNIYIVNPDMHLCPIGVKGEICVSGVGVGRGYLRDEQRTARVFMEDPFAGEKGLRLYKTGDIGRWLPNGIIEFFGRKDHQVKIRGFRIELGEIENLLLQHPLVKEAVVIEKEDQDNSKYLCAYLVPMDHLETHLIKTYLVERLPEYMVPAHFICLNEMPLTSNGKIDRKKLPEPQVNLKAIPYITGKMLDEMAASLIESTLEQEFHGNQLPADVKKSSAAAGINPANVEPFRCFIIGETTLPITCAEIILERGHQLLGIISSEPQVRTWANRRGIPLARSKKAEIASFLNQQPYDYLFSANNLVILPGEIINLAEKGVYNYHNGLLPTYAGSYAPYWAVMNMEKTHGITWHVMETGIDTGGIVKQIKINVDAKETGVSLNTKCFAAGTNAFAQLVEALEQGSVKPYKQNLEQRSYFKKFDRPASGAVFSFNWDALKIDALIRGLDFGNYDNPLGMPKLAIGKDFFVIPEISVLDSRSGTSPGTVIHISPGALTVSTLTKDIEVREIHHINGEVITIPEFVQKFNIQEGYRFTEPDETMLTQIDRYNSLICQYENFWARRLARLQPLSLINTEAETTPGQTEEMGCKTFTIPAELKQDTGNTWQQDLPAIAFAAGLAGLIDIASFDIGCADSLQLSNMKGLEGLFTQYVPLHVEASPGQTVEEFTGTMQTEFQRIRKRHTFARDIYMRYPLLKSKIESNFPMAVTFTGNLEDVQISGHHQLNLVVAGDGTTCMLIYNRTRFEENRIEDFLSYFLSVLQVMVSNPSSVIPLGTPAPLALKGKIHQPIKLGEFRIDTGEIEKCLLHHEDITASAVVVKVNPTGEKYLGAYVVSGKICMESELQAYLSDRLPFHLVPAYYMQLEKMPLISGGKINRDLLEKLEFTTESDYIAPRNNIETKLQQIWARELRLAAEPGQAGKIGIRDDFFSLGGDSIKSITLLSRINREFNIQLKMADLYGNNTIEQLAGIISQSQDQELNEDYREVMQEMEDFRKEFLEGT